MILQEYLPLWTLIIQVKSVVRQGDLTEDGNFGIKMAVNII